jgi:hypothetical protein
LSCPWLEWWVARSLVTEAQWQQLEKWVPLPSSATRERVVWMEA